MRHFAEAYPFEDSFVSNPEKFSQFYDQLCQEESVLRSLNAKKTLQMSFTNCFSLKFWKNLRNCNPPITIQLKTRLKQEKREKYRDFQFAHFLHFPHTFRCLDRKKNSSQFPFSWALVLIQCRTTEKKKVFVYSFPPEFSNRILNLCSFNESSN